MVKWIVPNPEVRSLRDSVIFRQQVHHRYVTSFRLLTTSQTPLSFLDNVVTSQTRYLSGTDACL